MLSGWNHPDSPFHAGEQQVQERLGVRDKIEAFARNAWCAITCRTNIATSMQGCPLS